jgi:hypothetical protein
MSPDSSLIVVRGAYRGIDPTYACAAHDATPGRYVLLHVRDNAVQSRKIVPASDRAYVESEMDRYRAVYVDEREDAGLLPLAAPAHAQSADLERMRRAKSDEELEALRGLSALTRRRLDGGDVGSATFRGAAQRENLKSAFEVTKRRGFTQYRGGLQDALGRVTDLTRVEAKTPAWADRLARVHAGLDAVERELHVGAAVDTLNDVFRGHLDASAGDVFYGDVVHHSGFEGYEGDLPLDVVEENDNLVVGVAIGDGNETALVYRSTAEPTYGAQGKAKKSAPNAGTQSKEETAQAVVSSGTPAAVSNPVKRAKEILMTKLKANEPIDQVRQTFLNDLLDVSAY